MEQTKGTRGLIKKTIAMILGITMAFGALMLPDNAAGNELPAASAYVTSTYEDGDLKLSFSLETDRNVTVIMIRSVDEHGETVQLPSSITYNGTDYPVTIIANDFLIGDQTVKTVIFPDSVKEIRLSCLSGSSVENIVLPDDIEKIENDFASRCPNLRSVKYSGTKIKGDNFGSNFFNNSNLSYITNDKGAICLGNWLIKYKPNDDVTSVKISDLGNNGQKIENIAYQALSNNPNITSVDLEGIKYIGNWNFYSCEKLTTVTNENDVESIGQTTFELTPWYENEKEKNLVKIGKCLIYYKTDASALNLEGFKSLKKNALMDCENLDTIFLDSDCKLGDNCFYVANEPVENKSLGALEDPLPINSTYKIKTIILDGNELTYSRLLEDPEAHKWLKANISSLKGSEIIKTMVEEKTKELFDEMDITYYGTDNDKIGTLTPTEEFYIRMKVHSYLSMFDYDTNNRYRGFAGAFLLGGKVMCDGYAEISHYLLECAGVDAQTGYSDKLYNSSQIHYWNATMIGDEWFLSDDGWDAQTNGGDHKYDNFLKSTTGFEYSIFHKFLVSYDSVHFNKESINSTPFSANRTLGDLNGDNNRDGIDVNMFWDYMNGESDTIDEKAADINFDGNVDVTDAVLLKHFVYQKAIDVKNIPIDGLAPSVMVAFLNGEDYKNIKYAWTERGGYIKLPQLDLAAPEGKKLSYDIGMVGETVRVTDPCTVINVKWIDEDTHDYSGPDSSSSSSRPESSSQLDISKPENIYSLSSKAENNSRFDSRIRPDSCRPDNKTTDGVLGDVNNDGAIDIEDAVAIIQHINGMTPLTADEESRADVSKDKNIDIDDAVTIISYINGNSTF